MPVGIGVMPISSGMMQVAMGVSPAGNGMSPISGQRTPLPIGMLSVLGVVRARRPGMLHAGLAEAADPGRMSPRPGGLSRVRGRVGCTGSAIDRGLAAGTQLLDVDGPFLDQLIENSIEAAAIRVVAEGVADVAARKVIRQAR